MQEVAFTGMPNMGGVQMRGVAVARALGVPFYDLRDLSRIDKVGTLILVKYHARYAQLIRQKCDCLIYDPLDSWPRTRYHDAHPSAFWSWTQRELNFDEIIATSPACAEMMREALPSLPVHLAPHHADPAITPGYNASGHVVYTGAVRYISAEKRAIHASCRKLGRKLVIEAAKYTPSKLQGAGLMLHIRLKPHDTHLNRCCKPQIKLENAAAAGLPVLASDHPCTTSLRPEVVRHEDNWEQSIRDGLAAEPLRNPVTLKEHVERLRKILDL
jgi:hypothetical protein